jgi:hypothetical protein
MTVIEHRKRCRIALQQQLPIRGVVIDHHPISRSRPHFVTEVNDASTDRRPGALSRSPEGSGDRAVSSRHMEETLQSLGV